MSVGDKCHLRGLEKSGGPLVPWELRGRDKQDPRGGVGVCYSSPGTCPGARGPWFRQRSPTYLKCVCASFVFSLAGKGREEREIGVRQPGCPSQGLALTTPGPSFLRCKWGPRHPRGVAPHRCEERSLGVGAVGRLLRCPQEVDL